MSPEEIINIRRRNNENIMPVENSTKSELTQIYKSSDGGSTSNFCVLIKGYRQHSYLFGISVT